jgi:hypothetical protein
MLLLSEGLNLDYNQTVTMSKAEVVLNADRTEGMIRLPKGTTNNRTAAGDVYQVDYKLYQLLPEDDESFLSGGRGRRRGGGGGSVREAVGTCAVVGNSGALLFKKHGAAIDEHNVVYRFNQAPVEGWEAHVGARTTHESLNSVRVKYLLYMCWMDHLLGCT